MKTLNVFGLIRSGIISAILGMVAMLGSTYAIAAQTIEPQAFYRLSTQFRGDRNCLDVYNGGAKNNMPHLTGCADYSGQYWKFTPTGNGYYRLTTMFRGANMCLDIHNGGDYNNQPHLVPCANYSGQFWSVYNENGWFRLTTQFRGPDMCLDIFNGGDSNNQPHLAPCANFSGQFWRLTRTNR